MPRTHMIRLVPGAQPNSMAGRWARSGCCGQTAHTPRCALPAGERWQAALASCVCNAADLPSPCCALWFQERAVRAVAERRAAARALCQDGRQAGALGAMVAARQGVNDGVKWCHLDLTR